MGSSGINASTWDSQSHNIPQRTLLIIKMKVTRVATLALAFGLLDMVTSTLIVTTTTATLAALANGVVAVGAVVLGASLLGALKGRGKRQAAECFASNDPDLYFSLAVNADHLGCSQRFVCEISARSIDSLTQEETLIRSIFTSNVTAAEESGKAILTKAATLGQENGILLCAEVFNKCPFDSKTLLQEFKKGLNQ